MSEKVAPSIFFTELDAILDTRLGTLMQMNPNCFPELVKAGYFRRDRDLFAGVNPDEFQARYRKRDKTTLAASTMTHVVKMMRNFVYDTYEGNIKTPYERMPKIVVNTYPYQLNEDELEAIKQAILIKIDPLTAEFAFVEKKVEQITPMYLRTGISMIAIYDPFEWLEAMAKLKVFDRATCPEITMISPLLLRNLKAEGYDMLEFQQKTEMMVKYFIDLQLLVSRIFSSIIGQMVDPHVPAKAATDTAEQTTPAP